MTISSWVARAAAEYRAGRALALLFDYDGTLAPIASHPSLALLPDPTRDLLAALAALDGVTVGVLSGRGLGRLKEHVGLTGLVYAGSGGMHLDLDGEELADGAMAEFERLAEPLIVALSEPVRWFPGAWVERKPGCLSVHYRVLTPLKAACLIEEVRDALADLGADCPPLSVREVSRALEVSLAGAWTKGDAVDRMLPARDPFAVYAGDAANDEEAVIRVNARGGVTVGVGPEPPPGVQVRVATPEDLAADLARLTRELASVRRPSPAGAAAVVPPRAR